MPWFPHPSEIYRTASNLFAFAVRPIAASAALAALSSAALTSKLDAEPIALFGIDIGMKPEAVVEILDGRGFGCGDAVSASRNDPALNFMEDFSFFLGCAREDIDIDPWLEARAIAFIAKIERTYTLSPPTPIEESPQRFIEDVFATPQYLMLFEEGAQLIGEIAAWLPFVIFYEYQGSRTIVFSCAVFNACGAPITEISGELFGNRSIRVREPRVFAPALARIVNAIALHQLELWLTDNPPANRSERVLADTGLDIFRSNALHFDDALSFCGFGGMGDSVCVYDGALRFSPARAPSITDAITRMPDAIRFMSGVGVDVRLFILDQGRRSPGQLSFD